VTRAWRRALALVALASAAAGCQVVLWSWPPGEPVPGVVGAWQGIWLVAPPLSMRVMFTSQDGATVSGFVTYELPSGAISTGLKGEFGVRSGQRVLLLTATGLDRTDDFELTTLEPDRLAGAGTGRGLGGQRGPVTLRRE
jgi:hypothetical protein